MSRSPRIVRNPDAERLAACDPWVRGVLTRDGGLFVWDTAGASHARLRASLGDEGILPTEAARQLALDAEFAAGVEVQRVGATTTFALAADLNMSDLPAQWRERIQAHLEAGRRRQGAARFVEREVMDAHGDMVCRG